MNHVDPILLTGLAALRPATRLTRGLVMARLIGLVCLLVAGCGFVAVGFGHGTVVGQLVGFAISGTAGESLGFIRDWQHAL